MRAVVLAFVVLQSIGADAGTTARFEIARDGLKFTGPCSATVYDDDRVAATADDATKPFSLGPGGYEALLSCPSTEGPLQKTVRFDVGRDDAIVPAKMIPGFLMANVVRDGVVVKARVTVRDERGRVVAEGFSRAVLPVPPGKLSVDVAVDPKAAGVDRAVVGRADAVVAEGKKEVVVVDTTDGEILVEVTDNGRSAPGIAALRVPGKRERFVEFEAGRPAPVPPGTYDVVASLKEAHDVHEEVKKGVVVVAKKRVEVKIAHRTGGLAPRAVADGAALDDVEVQVFAGEAPGAFATVGAGEVLKLSPGDYRVVVARKGTTLDDGTEQKGEARARVAAGATKSVSLDLSPARVAVSVAVGGAPKKLPVKVFLPGADAPVAETTTDARGKATLALQPGRYRVQAVLETPHGPLAKERLLTVKKGATARADLALDVGVVVVQAFEQGVAVPAEVLFYKGEGAAPFLVVSAGEDAFLPPASYALVVKRKGKETKFGALKVAAGRTLERQVELVASTTPAK
jgi:hypothetical protein